jgi:hypothetical protein
MIEQFVLPAYKIVIEYSYLFLAILLIVKLFQLVSSFKNGGEGSSPWDPWGNKGGDGDKDRDRRKESDSNSKKLKEDKDNGVGGTSYLKVRVVDKNGSPIKCAKVTIKSKRGGKDFLYNKVETNADGIVPGMGESFPVPSNTPIKIYVNYMIPKNEKYKSNKYAIRAFGNDFIKKREFTHEDILNYLKEDEERTHIIRLNIVGDEVTGFEPFIHSIKVTDDIIEAVGEVQGSTGR